MRHILRGHALYLDERASAEDLDAMADRARDLHLAGETAFDPRRVEGRAFMLGRTPLGLAWFASRSWLGGTACVVLSSCFGGLLDHRRISFRGSGFRDALLQGGASAVVAPLWDIGDLRALLFTIRFYEQRFLLGEDCVPAAVNETQRWLRDASEADMRELMTRQPVLAQWAADGSVTDGSGGGAAAHLARTANEPETWALYSCWGAGTAPVRP